MKNQFYNSKYNSLESRFYKFIDNLREEIKPIVKQKALACKCDMINTQHSLGYKGNTKPGKRFNDLEDFLAKIEDNFKLCYYFEIENGKFIWF